MTVDPALAKAHLRITSASEDLLIAQYLDAATSWVERFIGQKLSGPETVTDSFTAFGDLLQLSAGPFDTVTLTSVAYVDGDGEAATVSTGSVVVQDGKVYPPATGWPTASDEPRITVSYTVGFTATPPELDQAVLLLTTYFYENRGIAAPLDDSPTGCALNALCRPFRTPTLR